ncbi:aldose epimerase family protein [Roseburia sp. 1XD42-69]|uniref:aldose epimerase family protein n=1 Tax=Roseburia sp. 1XD42-69 TaxID=2320088 RepID=UPI000EA00576|nr:aldose epimerase family protein [Roseburia sp. 1XD42-69]RKJ63469.1 galactose mutarotase [Roseburia sp. 1XD42-69]
MERKVMIANSKGMRAEVCTLGATLVSLFFKDKNGVEKDLVLGYDNPADYLNHTTYFGATVGRNGNRIKNGKFTLNGTEYLLEKNDGENNLHSGSKGLCYKEWEVEKETENSVTLSSVSKDLEQGFPGTMTAKVTYAIGEDNALSIDYEAVSDKDTVANFTNHSYFNLGGHDSGTMVNQKLKLYSSKFTPVDGTLIPTGELRDVKGTPMDFTEFKAIGKEIDAEDEQLKFGGGYDHNFIVDGKGYRLMAEAVSEDTGIHMKAYTDAPAVQFYAGNFIKKQVGKGGCAYDDRHGFCLESQYCPDAVNNPTFESPILKAGETYRTRTVYQFSID